MGFKANFKNFFVDSWRSEEYPEEKILINGYKWINIMRSV